MRQLTIGLFVVTVMVLVAAGTSLALADKRVALVVGNSAYVHATPLKNPRNDANAVAAVLDRLGFEVIKGVDLDHDRFRSMVRKFARAIRGADVALLFYAGHGLQVNGRNYLAPVDAKLSDEADLDFDTLPLRTILRQMERETRTNLVFLDACRDNPMARNLARSMGTRSASVGRGLARVETGVGTLIAFATDPGNVAQDGTGTNSPFTEGLLKHIETPGLDVDLMLRRVRRDVLAKTSGRQVPWSNSSLTGRFEFASRKIAVESQPESESHAPPPRPSVDDKSIDLAFWSSVKDSEDAEDYRIYLERFPKGVFAKLAKRRIARLEKLAPAEQEKPKSPPRFGMPSLPTDTSGKTPAEMFRLARNYELGAGVPKNQGEAVRWYRRAADRGHATAMVNLGVMYEFGKGVAKDKHEAVRWYRKSADNGNARAMANLGYLYETGKGVTKSYREAARWYRKGADSGNARAMTNLGVLHEFGRGVAKDRHEAVRWYRKGAENGNAVGMTNLGTMYEFGKGVAKDYHEAVRWYRKGADNGHARGMVSLGTMYELGKGTAKDLQEAIRWYRKAAESGSARGMVNLGVMYEFGKGTAKDLREALRWYRKGAEGGNARGMFNLGTMYEFGKGTAKDAREAARWYRKGAEAGNHRAMSNLSIMYRAGKGVTRSYGDSVKWAFKAAEKGNRSAYYSLALAYHRGHGVSKDPQASARYMLKSLKAGFDFAHRQMASNSHTWSVPFRRELQRLLQREGVYDGAVDGNFGPGTKRAIRALSRN